MHSTGGEDAFMSISVYQDQFDFFIFYNSLYAVSSVIGFNPQVVMGNQTHWNRTNPTMHRKEPKKRNNNQV